MLKNVIISCVSGEIINLHNGNLDARLSAQTVANYHVYKDILCELMFAPCEKLQTATLGKRTAPSVYPQSL